MAYDGKLLARARAQLDLIRSDNQAEHQRRLSLVYARVPEIQLASIPAMEKMAALDPTFPDILRSCARESALIERTLWAEQEEGAEQEMLARGIVVTELSSEEKQKFRAAVQPLYDQFADQSELIARIQNS